MYFSTHLVAGAAVGKIVGSPSLAVLLGLGTHLVMDMLPHHDYKHIINGIIDFIVGFSILSYLYWTSGNIVLLFGAIAATIPDVEVVISRFRNKRIKYFPSHTGFVPHGRAISPWGIYTQIIFIILMLVVLSH